MSKQGGGVIVRRKAQVLEKRAAYLKEQMKDPEKDNGYRRAECEALCFAVRTIREHFPHYFLSSSPVAPPEVGATHVFPEARIGDGTKTDAKDGQIEGGSQ